MKKIFWVLLAILIILTVMCLVIEINKDKEYATLIQLSPTTNKRMMGYLMITSLGKVIVIDGGNFEDGKKLENYINKYGGNVDAWYITHYHSDHTGAFNYIVNNTNISIEKVYHSLNSRDKVEKNELSRIKDYDDYYSTLLHSKLKNKIIELNIGQKLSIDNVKIEILGIKNEEISNNFGNNQSVVAKFYIGETSILFLGDTGIESEEKLKNTVKEKLKSDYVQMSHHGQSGVSEEMYKLIDPACCLWPTTEWIYNNDSGKGVGSGKLKTLETRKWIKNIAAKSYIAKDGDFIITIH